MKFDNIFQMLRRNRYLRYLDFRQIFQKRNDNYFPAYIFLGLVVLLHLFYLFFKPTIFIKSILTFSRIIIEAAPALIIVFISFMLANLIIHPKSIKSYLNKSSKYKRWIIAVAGGLISMGPSFIWYPVLADLRKSGATNGFIVTFLANKSINIILFPTFILFFGLKYSALVLFMMILSSVVQGIVFEYLEKRKSRGIKTSE